MRQLLNPGEDHVHGMVLYHLPANLRHLKIFFSAQIRNIRTHNEHKGYQKVTQGIEPYISIPKMHKTYTILVLLLQLLYLHQFI